MHHSYFAMPACSVILYSLKLYISPTVTDFNEPLSFTCDVIPTMVIILFACRWTEFVADLAHQKVPNKSRVLKLLQCHLNYNFTLAFVDDVGLYNCTWHLCANSQVQSRLGAGGWCPSLLTETELVNPWASRVMLCQLWCSFCLHVSEWICSWFSTQKSS